MKEVARRRRDLLLLLAASILLVYLHDPPWLGSVTSGFGRWEQNRAGVRLRWMGGRASFFVPAAADRVDIPFQALFLERRSDPFVIDIRIDDRRSTEVVLQQQGWVIARVPIRPIRTRRRFRRVDLYANRTWGERSLSVQVGELTVRMPGRQ